MKTYTVAAIRFVNEAIDSLDYDEDFDTLEEAREAYAKFNPTKYYSREELDDENAYVRLQLEEREDGEVTDIICDCDF